MRRATGWDTWAYVSEKKDRILLTYVQIRAEANMRSRRIVLSGLDETAIYHYNIDGVEYRKTGAYLMRCGVLFGNLWGDMQSRQILLTAESKPMD